MQVYAISCVCPSKWPASCHPSIYPSYVVKTLTLDIMCRVFNQILSYLSCLLPPLTSTILYPCHFRWPLLRVTRSAQSKTCWLPFEVFNRMGWKLVWWWSNSSWMSWCHDFLSEILWINGSNWCFTASETLTMAHICMPMNQFSSNLVWQIILSSTFWY